MNFLILSNIFSFSLIPSLGSLPKNERLERVKKSYNYKNGSFVNREETEVLISKKQKDVKGDEKVVKIADNKKKSAKKLKNKRPTLPIDVIKTDLKNLDYSKNQVIWFGHSSYLLILGGKTFLVDPVLTKSFPSGAILKPFVGSDFYKPEDIPDIDYLVITHDHWDHLDYKTVKLLKERIKKIVCPLGVGAHFEKWSFKKVVELDWDDVWTPEENVKITCLTARHFSGRFLKRNQSLWASFMIEGEKTVFVGGDSGYGKHFAEIGTRFPNIDLAMIENGQYNIRWKDIHTMPEFLKNVVEDLHAKKTIPVHNSKFVLASHDWDEPILNAKRIEAERPELGVHVATIGEVVEIE